MYRGPGLAGATCSPRERRACVAPVAKHVPRADRRVAWPPRIVETLRKAIEWRRQLDAGEVPNQPAIARRDRITRARVTQIMDLFRLVPAKQERLDGMIALWCLGYHR